MTGKASRISLLAGIAVLTINCITFLKSSFAEDNSQPVQSLAVFDGKNKRVGNVLGFDHMPMVGIQVGRRLAILTVERDRFGAISFTAQAPTLLFESANCTGTPFVALTPVADDSLPAPFHLLDNFKLYAFDGPLKSIIVRSFSSGNRCDPANSVPNSGAPLPFLVDLGTRFQPPFTLR